MIDTVESTLDIAPTLLDIAGIAEPHGIQGITIKQVLSGGATARPSVAMTENDDDFAAMRMRTITTQDWRLTYYLGDTVGELIHRKSDPLEMHNLWDNPDYAAIKQELLDILLHEVLASVDMSNGRQQLPTAPIPKWRK